MSRVFLGTERQLGRLVVLKALSPELACGVSSDRFEREIRTAAQLQDPRIVPLFGAGVADGVPYYTMPFVEGESLRADRAGAGAARRSDGVGLSRSAAPLRRSTPDSHCCDLKRASSGER
jgi:eukaryotic-like serine/threonine-protein kinase